MTESAFIVDFVEMLFIDMMNQTVSVLICLIAPSALIWLCIAMICLHMLFEVRMTDKRFHNVTMSAFQRRSRSIQIRVLLDEALCLLQEAGALGVDWGEVLENAGDGALHYLFAKCRDLLGGQRRPRSIQICVLHSDTFIRRGFGLFLFVRLAVLLPMGFSVKWFVTDIAFIVHFMVMLRFDVFDQTFSLWIAFITLTAFVRPRITMLYFHVIDKNRMNIE